MPNLTTIFSAPEFDVLWQELRKKRRSIFIVTSAAVFSSSISAVIPFLYGRLTDIALNRRGEIKLMASILLLWLLLDILQALANRWTWRVSSRLAFQIWGGMLTDAASHLLELPLAFHRERKMGQLLTKLDRGIERSWNTFENVVFSLAPNLIALFVALILSFFIEWRMALLLLAIIAVYSLVSLKLIQPIIKIEPQEHRAWERAYHRLWESVLNVETVKSHTTETYERRRMKHGFDKAGLMQETVINLWRNLNFWEGVIFALGFVAVFGTGVFLISRGSLSAGKLVMFLGYMNLALSPLSRLADEYRQVRRASTGLKRALALFKNQPEREYAGAKPIGPIRGEVVFENVFFDYGKKQGVLKDISFEVEPGEVVALVGESGVGKTTLANLLMRYWLPKLGKILIDGKDVKTITYQSLRKQIAVVPQDISLFNDTIKNNIRYGRLDAKDEEILAASKAANAHEFIEKFPKKYKQLVGERGIKLSAGQKQRVAIARAILRSPRILILDEATSALDSASEKLVQEALDRLIRGRTTFIIAHRLSTIAKADKIIVLKKGTVAEIGTHAELLAKHGLYWNFWNLQTSLGTEIVEEISKVAKV